MDVKQSISAIAIVIAAAGAGYEGSVSDTTPDSVAPNEAVTFRSETSESFYTGKMDTVRTKDGGESIAPVLVAHIYTEPIHYRAAGDSVWRKIDPTVKPKPFIRYAWGVVTGGRPYEVQAGPYVAEFSEDKPQDYRFESGKASIEFEALFDTTGVEIKVESTRRGVKEQVILSEKSSKILSWKLIVDGAIRDGENGGWVVINGDGEKAFSIPVITATDANGRQVPVRAALDKGILTADVDTDGAAWPVTVDPSVAIIGRTAAKTGYCNQSGNDTYENVRNATSCTSVSTAVMYIGQAWDSGTFHKTWRSKLTFDTSSLSTVATIDSGKIIFCCGDDQGATNFALHIIEGTWDTAGDIAVDWYNDFTGWASSGAYTITDLADSISTTTFTTGDSLRFTLNATGLGEINTTGYSKFSLLSGRDIGNAVSTITLNEYIYSDPASLYLQVYYTPQYTTVPTGFVLHSPTVNSITASWTNNHTSGVDSLRIFTGTTWVKSLAKMDTTNTISGLSLNTQYHYRVRVDSLATFGYSNADTLYTLAAAPSSFALSFIDSTIAIPSWTVNSNPAATTWAIRDSTLQKWVGTDGIADDTSAAWLTYAQWTALNIQLVTNNIQHYVGVVARNADGVQTAYSWVTVTAGNVYTRVLSSYFGAARQMGSLTSMDATYLTARNDSTTAEITSASVPCYFGQANDANYYIARIWARFIIPAMTGPIADSLYAYGKVDSSSTDFNFVAAKGNWASPHPVESRFWNWLTWASSGAYSIDNLLGTFSSSSYSTTMRIPMSAFGDSAVSAAKSDTLRFTLLSSLDQAATSPTNYGEVQLDSLSLKIRFAKYDYVPSSVLAVGIAADSIVVTWTEHCDSETGYEVWDTITGVKISVGTLAAGTLSARIGGFTPNQHLGARVKVIGGKIDGQFSAADSCYTYANIPGAPTISFPTNTILKWVVNVNSNPAYTKFAVQESTTGKYAYNIPGVDSFGTAAWWGTYADWGGAGGDSMTVPIGKKYTLRAKAKNGE